MRERYFLIELFEACRKSRSPSERLACRNQIGRDTASGPAYNGGWHVLQAGLSLGGIRGAAMRVLVVAKRWVQWTVLLKKSLANRHTAGWQKRLQAEQA